MTKNKAFLGLALCGTLLLSIGVVIAAQPEFPVHAMTYKQSAGTSTEYSASLVMRASYNNEEKYFSYNDSTHIADVSNNPVEYTLSWVNGDSDNFSIYDGTHYLDIDTSANGTTKYGPGCFTAASGYSYSGKTGTWTGSAASVTFTASSNQVRITEIVITFN